MYVGVRYLHFKFPLERKGCSISFSLGNRNGNGICKNIEIFPSYAPLTFLILSIAHCYVYHKTATVAELTNVMATIFICIIVVSNNIILASKRFKLWLKVCSANNFNSFFSPHFALKRYNYIPFNFQSGRLVTEPLHHLYTKCDRLVRIFIINYLVTASGVTFIPILRLSHYWMNGWYPFNVSFLPYQI